MNLRLRRLGTWYLGWLHTRAGPARSAQSRSPLLIVVEGPHDVEFLKRISALLHRENPGPPNLVQAEAAGQIAFLPAGGGNLWTLPHRLAPFGLQEFHLYDREVPPVTEQRQQLVDATNARPNC